MITQLSRRGASRHCALCLQRAAAATATQPRWKVLLLFLWCIIHFVNVYYPTLAARPISVIQQGGETREQGTRI